MGYKKPNTQNMLTTMNYKQASFVVEWLVDQNPRRAAEAVGYEPEHGYKLLKLPAVQAFLEEHLRQRVRVSDVDAEWALGEAVDNHFISRQTNKMSASNQALALIMRHKQVDAFASEKMNMTVSGDKELLERLNKGRQRAKEISFL